MGGFALYIKKNINLCESMSLYIYFYCIGETPRWSSTFLDRYMIYELLSLAVKAYAYSIIRHCWYIMIIQRADTDLCDLWKQPKYYAVRLQFTNWSSLHHEKIHVSFFPNNKIYYYYILSVWRCGSLAFNFCRIDWLKLCFLLTSMLARITDTHNHHGKKQIQREEDGIIMHQNKLYKHMKSLSIFLLKLLLKKNSVIESYNET